MDKKKKTYNFLLSIWCVFISFISCNIAMFLFMYINNNSHYFQTLNTHTNYADMYKGIIFAYTGIINVYLFCMCIHYVVESFDDIKNNKKQES